MVYSNLPITIATSTTSDGTMKKSSGSQDLAVDDNRTVFLSAHDIQLNEAVLVPMSYGSDDYCRYRTVDQSNSGEGMISEPGSPADALATQAPGVALFLPLADCVGAVLYDPMTKTLMVAHLGRHNLEQQGATRSVEYMQAKFGCNPKNIIIWLSPAAGKENYPLFTFNNHSMHEVAIEQFMQAGIQTDHIETSPIDTTKDDNYFSHSEYLKGHRTSDGRFAVVAAITI